MSGTLGRHRLKAVFRPGGMEEEEVLAIRDGSAPFKLSVPAIIGIACVGLILIGLSVLLWRWLARRREIMRADLQLGASHEKYGVGRGVESSNSTQSSSSSSSKLDPYGSFFEVETEKPKRALLSFGNRRGSAASNSWQNANYGMGATAGTPKPPSLRGAMMGWATNNTVNSPLTPSAPGHGVITESSRSSFSFSLKKEKQGENLRPIQVQHLAMPTSIKNKAISAPLIVANEPWSPPPTSGFQPFTSLSPPPPKSRPAQATRLIQPPQPLPASELLPPPPPAAFPQKFKQSLSPRTTPVPMTPGSSRSLALPLPDSKAEERASLRAPEQYERPGSAKSLGPSSDGSLYSRNSFSSSNHGMDHHHHQTSPATSGPPPSSIVNEVKVTSGVSGSSSTLGSAVRVGPVPPAPSPQPATGKNQHQQQAKQSSSNGSEEVITPTRPESSTTYNPNDLNRANSIARVMTVVAPFTPTLEDEMALKTGDTVRVIEEYRDGWCLVQHVGRMDSPRGVVPCVCLRERKRAVPVPMNVGAPRNKASLVSLNQWR